jgi:hypothetical protein
MLNLDFESGLEAKVAQFKNRWNLRAHRLDAGR